MSVSFADFKPLIFAALLESRDSPAVRVSPGPALRVLSIFLLFAGTGFLLAAGYGWLADRYDTTAATLYMGIFALGSSFAAAFFAYGVAQYRHAKMKTYQKLLAENIHAAIDAVGEELEEPIRNNPKTAAMLAGLAGYVAAQKFM